jgi:L-asparaginase
LNIKHKIAIISTGGTIASSLDSNNEYKSGSISINEILPKELTNNIKIYEPFSVDSSDITPKKLLKLAKLIQKKQEKFDAIIVTHGTDTMCESAFFMHLVNKSTVPIIFTGAMRSSNAHDFDGIDNFKFALANIDKCGVFIAMNSKLINASSVAKVHTTDLDAFCEKRSPNIPQGIFNIPHRLPKTVILYPHSNNCFINLKVDIIVYAGFGNGTIPQKAKSKLVASNKIIIRASICPNGEVLSKIEDESFGFISSGYFNPLQARILAMLAKEQSREIFTRYAHEI